MKFGVFLPSFLLKTRDPDHPDRLRAFARRAEELGFDSLWITDHIITARRFYAVSWLDSLMTLGHVAAITSEVRLGTSILILPVRQPTVLAKEIATLHYLSGGRFICGIGTGWYEPEFEACGVRKAERGRRTDEVRDAMRALWSGPDASFNGRHYQISNVTVEPHPLHLPPIWAGGGRQLAHDASPEHGGMHPNVLRRIADADGWIARPTSPADAIATDLEEIRSARQRAGGDGSFTVAHENFTWLEPAGARDRVIDEQKRRFAEVVSDERPWDYIDSVYLTGTVEEIQAKIEARRDAGVEYLMLHTLNDDTAQLDLIARHLMQPFRST